VGDGAGLEYAPLGASRPPCLLISVLTNGSSASDIYKQVIEQIFKISRGVADYIRVTGRIG
jgi:hypothetical protein